MQSIFCLKSYCPKLRQLGSQLKSPNNFIFPPMCEIYIIIYADLYILCECITIHHLDLTSYELTATAGWHTIVIRVYNELKPLLS